jgi:hypothetical protein
MADAVDDTTRYTGAKQVAASTADDLQVDANLGRKSTANAHCCRDLRCKLRPATKQLQS